MYGGAALLGIAYSIIYLYKGEHPFSLKPWKNPGDTFDSQSGDWYYDGNIAKTFWIPLGSKEPAIYYPEQKQWAKNIKVLPINSNYYNTKIIIN